MPDTLVALYVFVLACFIGFYVIWGVTPSLHTPLVALTNAISIGFIAVTLASIKVFGGFLVTNRMLAMFRKKTK